MPAHTRNNWKAWNEERENFTARDTKGFTKDVAALEAHISKLIEVCPKDEAGWPRGTALEVIGDLQEDLETLRRYLAQLR